MVVSLQEEFIFKEGRKEGRRVEKEERERRRKEERKTERRLIVGKQSGTSNLHSSFAQYLGPDKDQHLKTITEVY